MHYWDGLAAVPQDLGPTVVTIGNFDGVHRGHRHVLDQVVAAARSRELTSVAITFDPHPAVVHRPLERHESITAFGEKSRLLADTGLDGLVVLHYTLEFAQATPEEFVRSVIVDALHAAVVVVGHDVRFGRHNSGDFATMQRLGAEYGFEVIAVEDFGEDRRCSSTWIRDALRAGDVAEAAQVLGRNHQVHGDVVHGFARGRELGFPTANLSDEVQGMVPADGVYAGWLHDESGRRWPAAVSVGSNPTFEGVARVVEAHVIDRPQEQVEDFDLYGQQVAVEFVQRLRGMVAFEGIAKLIEQMDDDVARTRQILLGAESAVSADPASRG
ncbi:bifunctional riboflavin kinase/FAD synthetase [Micrococcus terreus]|uniref:bifunctional riboflavin kinase/FAD synthetase n=1 Tax=Micrococcus terreus TaxID=574650 RepID=UPI0025510FC0|nr:bifunctional riboflavin kinase/FAD synthetase [Micrococcus terreus]MDK7701321.1 bifunctional riboflavin kinase/FAD synthetase [Micrococcus terreus]WOO97859.1 bifunctional riboflavin kinase/FAD synthetase [Micrococcus terreus]